MSEVPSFWVTNLPAVEALAGSAQRAEVRVLATSPGGRPVHAFSYGERQAMASTANYSSACGAMDKGFYAPLTGKKPVVLLLGAVHGAEVEGTAALVNLLHLLEEGRDLRGETHPGLAELAGHLRLVIVPVCNPDGRARFPHESALGMTNAQQRYFFQGTWKDGSLCDYPKCKSVHPIREASEHIGSYFNDDGVNLMHDNFFHLMARETQALLDLADEERADFIVQLHGGSNSLNAFLPTQYVTREVNEAIHALSVRCDAAAQKEGLSFRICNPPKEREGGVTPPSFNLASALHHVCGGVSAVFESNQRVADLPGAKLTHEEVFRSHYILFEQLFAVALGK